MLCSIAQLQFLWLDWCWTFSFLVLGSKKSWYYHIYVCMCVCVCKYICILLYINMVFLHIYIYIVLLHIYVILLSFINLKEKKSSAFYSHILTIFPSETDWVASFPSLLWTLLTPWSFLFAQWLDSDLCSWWHIHLTLGPSLWVLTSRENSDFDWLLDCVVGCTGFQHSPYTVPHYCLEAL